MNTDLAADERPMIMRPALLALALWMLATTLAACVTPPSDPVYQARIRRTEGGIPHIRADDLGSLGFGTLYAMAEDNLCILADQYLTLGAERSHHLGPGDGNLESDFFYRLLIDRGDAASPLPEDLTRLFVGAAAGYNHYLRTTPVDALPDARCRGAEWIREVDALAVKRVSRIDYALGYMLPIIVAAAPPDPESLSEAPLLAPPDRLAAIVETYLEVPKRGGSNGVAIGRAAALGGRGMLLANPHMPWKQPFQRFYPMHQTIPGQYDVLGANLIGRPRVGFGHTEHVAWTSTVSTAKRLTFYRLELSAEDPTHYVFDGRAIAMKRQVVTVPVRSEFGAIEQRSHTFYSTHFGGLLVESPFFAWTPEYAFAVRLVDAEWRGETALADQYQARSVRELKALHDREQFLPVNLIAADRQGEVLYADPGPIPNLGDDLVEACSVLHGAALDGTRSECQWQSDVDAAAPGVFPPSRLPFLYRDDYVTNSNDSYWLANPAEPLTGYPKLLGSEGTPRTLRTRSGLAMVQRELAKADGFSLAELQDLALANENAAGQLIRDDLVAMCRATPIVRLAEGREVRLQEACEVLASWDLHADLDSRGAHLFREFLSQANGPTYTRHLPRSFVPLVAFDPTDAVSTPHGLDPERNPDVLSSLAKAVLSLEAAGIPLDARLGDLQHVTRNERRIALHGGPESGGVFNKIEADFRGAAGYPDVDRSSSSWILAVEFTDEGPRSRGILTYSLSANPESPHYDDQTRMFSRKQWLELPFRDRDVEAAARRAYVVTNGTP